MYLFPCHHLKRNWRQGKKNSSSRQQNQMAAFLKKEFSKINSINKQPSARSFISNSTPPNSDCNTIVCPHPIKQPNKQAISSFNKRTYILDSLTNFGTDSPVGSPLWMMLLFLHQKIFLYWFHFNHLHLLSKQIITSVSSLIKTFISPPSSPILNDISSDAKPASLPNPFILFSPPSPPNLSSPPVLPFGIFLDTRTLTCFRWELNCKTHWIHTVHQIHTWHWIHIH